MIVLNDKKMLREQKIYYYNSLIETGNCSINDLKRIRNRLYKISNYFLDADAYGTKILMLEAIKQILKEDVENNYLSDSSVQELLRDFAYTKTPVDEENTEFYVRLTGKLPVEKILELDKFMEVINNE